MKFRPQRGGFAESMAEVVDIEPNLRALADAMMNSLSTCMVFEPAIKVIPYCYDDRNGWKTHIVTVDGQAIGFTDGPCTENGQ